MFLKLILLFSTWRKVQFLNLEHQLLLSTGRSIPVQYWKFVFFNHSFIYQSNVDGAKTIDAEKVEVIEDVLIDWGDGLLIFWKNYGNYNTNTHADQESKNFKFHLRVVDNFDTSFKKCAFSVNGCWLLVCLMFERWMMDFCKCLF